MGDPKILLSRNGLRVTIGYVDGQNQVVLDAPGGQKVTLGADPSLIHVDDGNGNTVRLDVSGISVTSPGAVTVNASHVTIAAAEVTVDAGLVAFSGVVRADSVIANSVVSASYSPGAGNIW